MLLFFPLYTFLRSDRPAVHFQSYEGGLLLSLFTSDEKIASFAERERMDIDAIRYGVLHDEGELKLLLTKASEQIGPGRDYDVLIDPALTEPGRFMVIHREQVLRGCDKPPLGSN